MWENIFLDTSCLKVLIWSIPCHLQTGLIKSQVIQFSLASSNALFTSSIYSVWLTTAAVAVPSLSVWLSPDTICGSLCLQADTGTSVIDGTRQRLESQHWPFSQQKFLYCMYTTPSYHIGQHCSHVIFTIMYSFEGMFKEKTKISNMLVNMLNAAKSCTCMLKFSGSAFLFGSYAIALQ